MARPTTKTDLIIATSEQFDKLWKLVDSMTDEQQNAIFSFEDRDRNVRDVLVHLYEWHQLLLNWTNANRKGEQKPFLPEPYNWKTYPQMNVEIWKKHQNTPLPDAKKMLKESHSQVMKLIEAFSNDELFGKDSFSWTGGSTLGAYCVSATSSHYNWAMKKIKKHIKSYQ
ncbi:MAG: ClbS/DfsB family four-helix bundle protein [Prevotellaceae bacterium]|jgi:hypothetical protein|nr:ClbS/DfsB family four-helix bundle protein [Prevotellaceae bacterium]